MMKVYQIRNKVRTCEVRFFRTRKEAIEYKRISDEKWSCPVACQVFGFSV